MHHLLEIWVGWVLHGGYAGIIVLMAMESSIFPVPSEIVIPPAAFLAAQGKLKDPKDPLVLEKQVRRMLSDPKSEALIANFTMMRTSLSG